MHIYIYICMCICICVHIYMYVYIIYLYIYLYTQRTARQVADHSPDSAADVTLCLTTPYSIL